MKLHKLIIFIIVVSLYSCEYDYDIDLGNFSQKVVMNSVINPDSTVKVTLIWSRHTDDTSAYKGVDRFTAKLYENNSVIFDGEGIDGVLATAVYPKEGAKYRLEIDVPQYGKLSAETSIPLMPTIDLNYTGPAYTLYHNTYQHFTLKKITPNSVTRSLMIRVKDISFPALELHANNAFCDQFNAVIDLNDSGTKGSSVDYDHYIRIPYKNIDKVTPLKFSFHDYALSDTISTRIIAPSDEYDKYCKSVYQQNQFNSIFGDIYSAHSNIENGLGIFAGYSSVSVITGLKYD